MYVLLYIKKNMDSSLTETLIAKKVIHVRLFLHIYNGCEGESNVLEMEDCNLYFLLSSRREQIEILL